MMFLIQATMHSYRSLVDGSVRIVFDSQEMDAELTQKVIGCHQKFGHLYFKAGDDPISKDEQELLDETGVETEKRRDIRKSKSQQLRAVIYRMWEQKPEGTSEEHYQKWMDKLINGLKEKHLQ